MKRDSLLRRLSQLQRELLWIPPPELGCEWLTEAERCDKDTRTEDWRTRQHTIQKNRAKEFEKLNDVLQPIWPLDCDDLPYDALIDDDDDSSVESDDNIIVSAAVPYCEYPEGATKVVVRPPRQSARLKVPTNPPPPRRSRRLRGEESPSVNLEAHPDYARCNTSSVTDRMRDKGFI